MTEAGEKWVEEQTKQMDKRWDMAHPLSLSAAEFWLTRIFAEIEREAKDSKNATALYMAFSTIKARFGL